MAPLPNPSVVLKMLLLLLLLLSSIDLLSSELTAMLSPSARWTLRMSSASSTLCDSVLIPNARGLGRSELPAYWRTECSIAAALFRTDAQGSSAITELLEMLRPLRLGPFDVAEV